MKPVTEALLRAVGVHAQAGLSLQSRYDDYVVAAGINYVSETLYFVLKEESGKRW